MGNYIKGRDREQLVLFPTSLEEKIAKDNEVRVIDAFVESLDMKKVGIKEGKNDAVGRRRYNPKDMLKIYLYGYRNRVRSSRKLMKLCENNIEMMWLVKQIEPDFRSISDFRKENAGSLKKVFVEFNIICKEIGILNIKEVSQDGTKIRAVNSKDKNYTLNKIDDRIERIEEKVEEYLKELEEEDKKANEEKMIKIEELKKRKAKYEEYKKEMEEKGESQKSITDKEARLMKDNGAYNVCYNMQALVTTDNHMMANYEITNNPADYGSMKNIVEECEEELEEKIEANITDKGYRERKDMMECLEMGVKPEVTLEKEEETIELETVYEENEVTEEEIKSRKKEDIKKVLRAGKIPEIYKDKIKSIKVEEKRVRGYKEEEELEELGEEEKRELAYEEKIFIRDIEKEKVYCPEGRILRKKSVHGDRIRYCNKLACKNCKRPCTRAEYKEVDFREGQKIVIPNGNNKTTKKKGKREKVETKREKRVKIEYKVDKDKVEKRKTISEHNHGSMKRWDNAGYCLLKGKEKVTGEVALYCCAYNIRRAINICTVEKLLEYFEEKKKEKGGKEFTKNVKNAIINIEKLIRMELWKI